MPNNTTNWQGLSRLVMVKLAFLTTWRGGRGGGITIMNERGGERSLIQQSHYRASASQSSPLQTTNLSCKLKNTKKKIIRKTKKCCYKINDNNFVGYLYLILCQLLTLTLFLSLVCVCVCVYVCISLTSSKDHIISKQVRFEYHNPSSSSSSSPSPSKLLN